MRFVQGSPVVVVGGGPAGSFAALHLLRLAAQAGLRLDLTILEPRDFSRPGPGGCNQCAGILSSTLVRSLERLDLALPPEVVQAELDAYVLHLGEAVFPLRRPDASRRIVSVYRGGGPRLGEPPAPRSFDGWLLDQARERGAQVRRERVRVVRPGPRPEVVTAHRSWLADLVVVATGVNSRAPLDPAWGYRPPAAETMAQDEVLLPGSMLGDSVHIFFDHPPGLVFGGLIPKGRYTNISLLGRGLPPGAVADFLEGHDQASALAPQAPLLCGCTPRVAVRPARGYFADRLVVVGDAAVTRLYKDGIGAAFLTAEAAARTAVEHGVSRRDFAAGYHPVGRQITTDNLYGRLLFRLWAVVRRWPFLRDAWHGALLAEVGQSHAQHIYTRAAWGMFTGDESYRRIFWLSASWAAQRSLWRGAWQAWRRR